MFKKIQCRVIASAVLGDANFSNDKTFTENNPIINNLSNSFMSEMLTYTNRTGTIQVNYDDGHTGGLLDVLF